MVLAIGDTLKTVGANESNTEEFDGYLSQVYLVDGQQLTPASFGETDDNGVWRPIELLSPGAVWTASALSIAFTDSAVDDPLLGLHLHFLLYGILGRQLQIEKF